VSPHAGKTRSGVTIALNVRIFADLLSLGRLVFRHYDLVTLRGYNHGVTADECQDYQDYEKGDRHYERDEGDGVHALARDLDEPETVTGLGRAPDLVHTPIEFDVDAQYVGVRSDVADLSAVLLIAFRVLLVGRLDRDRDASEVYVDLPVAVLEDAGRGRLP
jgi:hypothetical protein